MQYFNFLHFTNNIHVFRLQPLRKYVHKLTHNYRKYTCNIIPGREFAHSSSSLAAVSTYT